MPVRIVQSKQNARLKELRRALAKPGRDTHGLAGIEGPNLVAEALRAGLRIATIFVAQEAQHLLAEFALPPDLEVLLVPRDFLDAVLETETPQPVAALVEMPDWTWAHLLRPHETWPPLVLLLAGLQDPGNLGTILRSAEAFGASGIVCLPETVCPWNPKAVRASAGSIFRLPLVSAPIEECFSSLREAGVRVLTTTAHHGEPVEFASLAGPIALLIGNEGNGVPQPLAIRADEHITIPCPGPVESLNAAVATGILLYEACRQRAAGAGGPHELRGSTR